MRKVIFIACGCLLLAQVNPASGDFIVFSGETYLSMESYFTITFPNRKSFDTMKLFEVDYLNILATDAIAYDFASREFRVYRSTTPFDLVSLHDDFGEYSVYYDTAVYDEDMMLFHVGVDINDINGVMAFTYVGDIPYGEFLNVYVSGGGIPDGPPDTHSPGTVFGRVWIDIAGHTDLSVLNATVSLQGTGHTTVSDTGGNFSLGGIPPGIYTLVVTAPDMVPLNKEITISGNQAVNVDLPKMTVLTQEDLDLEIANAITAWDVGGDGKIGIEEAIRALQVVSGAASN